MNIVEPIRNLETLHQIEEFLKTRKKRDLVLFVMGTNTGLRVSDILALNIRDVKNKDFVEIVEKKPESTKNSR